MVLWKVQIKILVMKLIFYVTNGLILRTEAPPLVRHEIRLDPDEGLYLATTSKILQILQNSKSKKHMNSVFSADSSEDNDFLNTLEHSPIDHLLQPVTEPNPALISEDLNRNSIDLRSAFGSDKDGLVTTTAGREIGKDIHFHENFENNEILSGDPIVRKANDLVKEWKRDALIPNSKEIEIVEGFYGKKTMVSPDLAKKQTKVKDVAAFIPSSTSTSSTSSLTNTVTNITTTEFIDEFTSIENTSDIYDGALDNVVETTLKNVIQNQKETVEKMSFTKTRDLIIKKSAEKTVENAAKTLAGKISEKTPHRSAEKIAEKIFQFTKRPVKNKLAKKSAEKTVANTADKIAEKITRWIIDKKTENTLLKTAETTANSIVEKIKEKVQVYKQKETAKNDIYNEISHAEFKSRKKENRCPYLKKTNEFNYNMMADVWQTLYSVGPDPVNCFKLHIRKTLKEERTENAKKFGDFGGYVNWDQCFLEVRSNYPMDRIHYLQGNNEGFGVLDNIILEEYVHSQPSNGTTTRDSIINEEKTTKQDNLEKRLLHYRLHEESADQWQVINNLLLMRDCESGNVLVFTRITHRHTIGDIEDAVIDFGETETDGQYVCKDLIATDPWENEVDKEDAISDHFSAID